MSIYIDADALAKWEKGDFDLRSWLRHRGEEPAAFPATVWQQLLYGVFAWEPARAAKRMRSLVLAGGLPVVAFSRVHAQRAARLASELKESNIGFADFQSSYSSGGWRRTPHF